MAKEWYREINFRAKSLRMINWLNKVIANYQQQGLKLTLRWHYQRTKILRAYGLTLDDYDKLLALQGGVCAICLCPPKPGKAFNVDHCHETGAVRGLLCFRCNFGLSFFREDETVFKRVLEHLKRRYVPEQ